VISKNEIVELQLQSAFGAMLQVLIKSIVNREMDEGIWIDGYEIAFTKNALNHAESMELLHIVLKKNPEMKIDLEKLSHLFESELPQSVGTKIDWLVSEDGCFVVSDSLRVGKFKKNSMLWRTPRISIEGIIFTEIKNNEVHGLSWHGRSYPPDEPFVLNYVTGRVVLGNIVKF